MKRFLSVFLLAVVLSALCAGCFPVPLPDPPPDTPDDDEAQLTEAQALECYEDIFNLMPPELLIMTDAEINQCNRDGIDPYWFIFMAAEATSGSLQELDQRYISDAEKAELEELVGTDSYYSVYSIADIQETCNAVWGIGRLSVDQWPSSFWAFYTDAGYIIAMQGYGDNGNVFYRDIAAATADGEVVVVSVHWLLYNLFSSEVYDMATDEKLAENLELPYTESFDDFMDAIDVSEEQLGVLEMVFYMTEDGVRLWGTFPQGHVSYPE